MNTNDSIISCVIDISQFSNLQQLLQVTAHVLRFLNNQKARLSPDNQQLLPGLISLTDRNGILRCGGLLSHADLPYSAEHPIHIDANHGFTNNVGMRNVPC